jgi:hypothetical protein
MQSRRQMVPAYALLPTLIGLAFPNFCPRNAGPRGWKTYCQSLDFKVAASKVEVPFDLPLRFGAT